MTRSHSKGIFKSHQVMEFVQFSALHVFEACVEDDEVRFHCIMLCHALLLLYHAIVRDIMHFCPRPLCVFGVFEPFRAPR
jgi:hypothetical protein